MAVVKVWKQGSSLIITLPAQVCDLFGIKEGDELVMDVEAKSNSFVIKIEGQKWIEK